MRGAPSRPAARLRLLRPPCANFQSLSCLLRCPPRAPTCARRHCISKAPCSPLYRGCPSRGAPGGSMRPWNQAALPPGGLSGAGPRRRPLALGHISGRRLGRSPERRVRAPALRSWCVCARPLLPVAASVADIKRARPGAPVSPCRIPPRRQGARTAAASVGRGSSSPCGLQRPHPSARATARAGCLQSPMDGRASRHCRTCP